jgi:hypothetical protein
LNQPGAFATAGLSAPVLPPRDQNCNNPAEFARFTTAQTISDGNYIVHDG